MRKLQWALALAIFAGLSMAGCARTSGPLSTPEPKTSVTQTQVRPGSQDRWNAVLAEARSEGTVSIYTHWLPSTRVALGQAFREKYGINLEFSTFTNAGDLMAKVQAEQRAGLYAADIFGMGVSALLNNMKPDGLLGPIPPLLIQPDVLDPKVWLGGQVPLSDKEGLSLSMSGLVMHMIVYNTDLVKDGEITSYRDLLKPQYKGKITMHDPSISGSGVAAITHVGHYLWGKDEAIDFLKRLIVDQQVIFQRDYRLHLESVVRGKYAIAFAPTSDLMAEFLAIGAPIRMATVEEDTIWTSSAGAFGVPVKLAHPNATAVFVNWLLSKEGQTVFIKTIGNPSKRLDVTTEGIDPLFIPDPTKKYYDGNTEESIAAKTEWRTIAKQVMDQYLK